MKKTATIVKEQAAPILYSDKPVPSHDIHKNIIPVYRQVRVNDITSRFFHDEGFRRELCDVGEVWTADMGVRCSGAFRVCEDGTFSPINAEKLISLPEGQQSHHFSGNGQVAVRCSDHAGKLMLFISGERRASRIAKVAFIKDNGVHAALGENAGAVLIPIQELREVQRAFDRAMPSFTRTPQTGESYTLIETIRELLRDRT